jgi:hypothetical protein
MNSSMSPDAGFCDGGFSCFSSVSIGKCQNIMSHRDTSTPTLFPVHCLLTIIPCYIACNMWNCVLWQ